MCAGSDSGAVASATFANGAKGYFSDDGNRDYGEGGATWGGTTPAGKIRYQRMISGMSRSRTLQALFWYSLMMQLRGGGL